MFVITEADAAAIRAVFNQEGELSAVIELRRRFPGASPASPGDRAASPQGQLARHRTAGSTAAYAPEAARCGDDAGLCRDFKTPIDAHSGDHKRALAVV
jgi:hypothetical protein